MIDTHAHLNFPAFKEDREAVITRCQAAGLTALINVGTEASTSQESVALAHKYNWIYASVGVHPHHVDSWQEVSSEIKLLGRDPRVVAVGEIGLDYFRNPLPAALQIAAFREQLDLALAVSKPVIIHSREAMPETISFLKDYYIPKLPSLSAGGVIHSFTGTKEQADQIIQMGFYIGLNNIISYPANEGLREIITVLPLDKILLETDAPYLPPQDHRGHRCEPADVKEVASLVATLKNISVDEVISATTQNAQLLFGLKL